LSDLRSLSAAAFAPYVGSGFTLESADGAALPVTLAACAENPRGGMRNAARTAFSLHLECPAALAGPGFSDGELTLRHPELGDIGPVHVVRVLPGSAGREIAAYQIIFN
jgi:hypothetical protein